MGLSVTRRSFLQKSAVAGSTVLCSRLSAEARVTTPVKRLSIGAFSQNAQMVADFRAAVDKMRGLPPRHPFSWVFQANIHWRPFFPDFVYQQADESDSPEMQVFRDNTGFSPEAPVFDTCPHRNWWFLPWHRAYLYCFERILRWACGKPDFALPYWNYSASDQRSIPVICRQPTLPNDVPNSLYLPATVLFRDEDDNPQIFPVRDQSLNSGLSQMTEFVTNSNALSVIPFSNSAPAPPREAFGSPQACDATCGCGSGALERIPHNVVHVAIGGAAIVAGEAIRVGFMGDVTTAARDPLFWLHHCQIDRLWESWIALGDGRLNPDDPAWLEYEFTFYDVDDGGRPVPVTMTPSQVLDTKSLGYEYDQLEQPPAAPSQPQRLAVVGQHRLLGRSGSPRSASTAVVGAPKAQGVPLDVTKIQRIGIKLTGDVNASQRARDVLAQPVGASGEAVVLIEGVQLLHQPSVYFDLYLGLPDNVTPSPDSPYYLGSISFFGQGQHLQHHRVNRRLQPFTFRVPERLRGLVAATGGDLVVTFIPQTGVESIDSSRRTPMRTAHAPAVTIREVKLLIVK